MTVALEQFRLSSHRQADPFVAPRGEAARPVATAPRVSRRVGGIAIGAIGGLGLAAIVVLIALRGNAVATSLAFIAAVVPLVVVAATLCHLDRWEPEPPGLLVLAVAWGSGVATSLALVASYTGQAALVSFIPKASQAEELMVTIQAPLVEEALKGLGVVVLVVGAREKVSAPLDGIVIAGLVGAGFAFTENILYFVQAGESVVVVFVLRAIASPFCHSMFTSFTGLAVAMGLTRMSRRRDRAGVAAVGLATAVVLHAAWNGLATYIGAGFLVAYLAVWVPFFCGWFVVLWRVSRQEQRAIAVGLVPFVEGGWITSGEAALVGDLRARRIAIGRARRRSRALGRDMRRFVETAARLALTRSLCAPHMEERAKTLIAEDLQRLEHVRDRLVRGNA
ncbi:MAG: PrsW family intramembrane metalloprotease [Actinomycetaceae bacterium]|nr:PrsW family intramembrane metalloprotease [Actinomycetaceae bacterium]